MRWRLTLGAALVAASAAAYYVHYLIFDDPHHIFIYLVGDIAFVPLEVLLVTLILHELLSHREKTSKLKKMNMVIGAFFNEVGTDALAILAGFDPDAAQVGEVLRPRADWTDTQFKEAANKVSGTASNCDADLGDLAVLKSGLVAHRSFLLRLLENPNLLEHESFTDLLWATFHLADELENRQDLTNLPASDRAHLSGDIQRTYGALISEWLSYMQHLKSDYPYLYSLALRTNPFDPSAVAEVA